MVFVIALFGLIKALAWPFLSGLIAFWFRTDISVGLQGLLPRVTKIGPSGVELQPMLQDQQKSEAEDIARASELSQQTSDLQQPPAVRLIATALRKSLEAVSYDNQIDNLIIALAKTRLELGHARVYRIIFGSQIRALAQLNQIGRASLADARQFFEITTDAFRTQYAGYGFDSWLNFLIKNELVSGNGEFLEITEFGRDFLAYLIQARLPEKGL